MRILNPTDSMMVRCVKYEELDINFCRNVHGPHGATHANETRNILILNVSDIFSYKIGNRGRWHLVDCSRPVIETDLATFRIHDCRLISEGHIPKFREYKLPCPFEGCLWWNLF